MANIPTKRHELGRDVRETLADLLREARNDLQSQSGRVVPDIKLIHQFDETALDGGLVDDRGYLVEGVVQLAASLPNGSKVRERLNSGFIDVLWKKLLHPPISYLGDEFRYRTADGSNNNIMFPRLGASGSSYARSVVAKHPKTFNLPDPSIIFESLLSRNGPPREHPAQVSSTLFHFATIIIHDLFHSDNADPSKLKNSSYLDLGPLYGHNYEDQKRVRTFQDGKLKRDTFSEQRLLGQPPGVCALMVAFNRFHNYIVQELAIINENGRFSLPVGMTESDSRFSQAVEKRDNDLFQTGRLITCGLYVNIILGDYLRTILNLNRNPVNSDWKLDPREDFDQVFDKEGTPRGIGNQVSIEFNLIYRWHSAISAQDEAWANDLFHEIFGHDANPDKISTEEYIQGFHKWARNLPKDPENWSFGGLKRTSEGSFDDSDLVRLIQSGTENIAGAFGVRNIPRVLRIIELLGIKQGRDWGLASLNEFRAFFKLKPYTDFKDVNPDPDIAETLRTLYEHPDNIELYPGLLAEDVKKPLAPGSGLCPGFTTSSAILADAATLVRADRFYSVEYGPSSLTSFGMAEASSDPQVAGGGVIYKLLMRAFPEWYRANSVYALYPFTTPDGNKEALGPRGIAAKLDFDRPSFVAPPHPVSTWQGVVDTLKNQAQFRVPWGPHTFQLTHHDYMHSGDSRVNASQRALMEACLYDPKDGMEQVRHFYEETTRKLLRQKGRKIGVSTQIDVVRDLGNLVHSAFVSHFFDIPVKENEGDSQSYYTEASLYRVLADLFGYVFLDLESTKSFKNSQVAAEETKQLGDVLRGVVADIDKREASLLGRIFQNSPKEPVLRSYGPLLIKRMLEKGYSVDDVVWAVIPTAAAACATQAQGWAQLIDLYLSDEYYHHWASIRELAQSNDPDAFEKLKKYALEGFRLSTPAFGLVRISDDDKLSIHDGAQTVSINKGDSVFVNFVTAGRDPSRFPNPEKIDLQRPEGSYIHHGWGPHACLGRAIVTTAAASMLRVCARLDNFRRAPGLAGEMKHKTLKGALKLYLSEDGSSWSPFPTNKKVLFDGIANGA